MIFAKVLLGDAVAQLTPTSCIISGLQERDDLLQQPTLAFQLNPRVQSHDAAVPHILDYTSVLSTYQIPI